MTEIKVKTRDIKRIDGKTFEIWRRFTTKTEAQAERKSAAKKFRHARVVKEATGAYGVYVTWLIGSETDHMQRGGTINRQMQNGRMYTYRH